MVAIAVAPLLWTSWSLFQRSRDILELDQKSSQLDKARGLSEQIALYTGGIRADVASLAQFFGPEADSQGMSAVVSRLAADRSLEGYITASGHFYSISVLGPGCQGAQWGTRLSDPEVQTLVEQGCRVALQGQAEASPPVAAPSVKEPVMVVAEPIRVGQGPVLGAVVAAAGLGPVWRMTQEMAGGTAEVYVVDRRGRLVAHSDTKLGVARPDVSNIEIVQRFRASLGLSSQTSQTMPFTLETPQGPQRMLGTFTPVPDDSGWGVVAQVSEEKAYFDADQMWRFSRWLVASVAFVAIGFAVAFAQRISRPIQDLARGARRLAEGDYATRVDVATKNEVGVLAGAFNHMGGEIQKHIQDIRLAAETNKELFMGTIKMLANAIDEKDVYTRGHSERVAHYSQIMARQLGLSDAEIERAYLSGILHDVGKIGIDDRILRKPAALTDDEYEMMKEHPRKGEYILGAVPRLKDLAGDGLLHHENLDGSGYPDGLKGDQIPLLARIVSVADAFDAMTTDRPYSQAWTDEKAIERLRSLVGKKFDGRCVEALGSAAAQGSLSSTKARVAAVVARRA